MKTHHNNISGAHKSCLQDKLIASAYIKKKKEKEIQTIDLTTQFKNLEKREQTKSKSFYSASITITKTQKSGRIQVKEPKSEIMQKYI